MSEISDLENRISAAMDRIGRGVEALSAAQGGYEKVDDGHAEILERALEDEKLANAQLEERVRALIERQSELEEANKAAEDARAEAELAQKAAEAALAAAKSTVHEISEDDIQASRAAMKDLSQRLRRMRRVARYVRESNQKLREAAEKGVTDPSLINASLQAELQNLRATREAELASTDLILAGLRPMLAGAELVETESRGDG